MVDVAERSVDKILDLSGKNAVVTGAAAGIGLGIAKRLAEAGAHVLMADLDEAALKEACQGLAEQGYKVDACPTDVSQEAQVVELFSQAKDKLGGVDILVNNAGIYPVASILEHSVELWERVAGVNLGGTFMCSQQAARQMVDQGQGGVIINISSMSGIRPSGAGMPSYDATKAGVHGLTRNMALELAPHGVRVLAVAPGGVWTPGVSGNFENADEATKELLQNVKDKIPLGRWAQADDVARLVLFLASDAGGYLTGSTVVIDGGALLHY